MRKKKILIIEDNEQNIYLVTFLLEKNGFLVIQARNGMDGISMANAEQPDLILLDIQLPVMDGYAVARELRKGQALQSTPIIAVTSFAMPGDKDQAILSGCTGYIEKPIDPDKFVSQISLYLDVNKPGG